MPNEIKPNQYTGALFSPPTITDFRAGAIAYEVRNPSGQWDDFLPAEERQSRKDGDSFGCVTFSGLNSVEAQHKLLTGEEVNLSDRFTAKMSGTTLGGNYANRVADSMRNDGLVLEVDYPFPELFEWNDFYKVIPSDLACLGRKWLDKWELSYEWVYTQNPFGKDEVEYTPELMMYHLKQSPLQVLSKVCAGWSTQDIVPSCGVFSGHATLIYGYEEGRYWKCFDTYYPFKKKLAWDYGFKAVMKHVLRKKRNLELLKSFEGKYVMRVKANGEVYKVENGELKFLDSNKQDNRHIPLVDEVITILKNSNNLIGLTEEQYRDLI
jgi:hypothetical protein